MSSIRALRWLVGAIALGFVSVAAAQLNFDPELILGPTGELPAAPAPQLDALPERTPYPIFPVRGFVPSSEDGQLSGYLLIHGAPKPVVMRTALGKFCAELSFDKPGTYKLELRNQDIHGTVSEATRRVVTFDPTAPGIPGLRNCAGTTELGMCEPSSEVCDNGTDDDCDGLIDRRDPDCDRDCDDDALELRDGSTPFVGIGLTGGLRLCDGLPGEDKDRFGVHVRAGHGLLVGVEAVGVPQSDPVSLRIEALDRSMVVQSNNLSSEMVALGFYPSQINTQEQAQNVEFEVSEVNGRRVEYRLYTDIVRIKPSQDRAANPVEEAPEEDTPDARKQ